MMVISGKSREKFLGKQGLRALLLAVLSLMLVAFIAPVASAQTTDNPDDVLRGLANNGTFVAPSVKANQTFMSRNPNIEQELQNTVNKLKGKEATAIGFISRATIPAQFNNTDSYANFLYGRLNPKPSVLVLVNAEQNNVSLMADKLSASERKSIVDESLGTFTSRNNTAGAIQVAERAVNKIESNATGGLVTTIVVVLVIVLAIAGAVAFMVISTKNKWKQQLAQVEGLYTQVSEKVLNRDMDIKIQLLDNEAAKSSIGAEYGAANRNFGEANTQLRELQTVSPVTLLLKGPEYQRKLNLTGSQLQQAQQSLTRIEQQLRSLPG